MRSSSRADAPLPSNRVLVADLRARAFTRAAGPARIGAEVELLPVETETRKRAPIWREEGRCTLRVLRRVAGRLGWAETLDEGAPKFRLPSGGCISHEPGGQIEVSSAPCGSVGALVRSLHEVIVPLREECEADGIQLLEVGIDPMGSLAETPLQLRSERYLRMDEYFARIGPAGGRMMRQTASLHVNLDWADDVTLHWRVLQAAVPFLTAIFANSRIYQGADTALRSYRALTWMEVDPGRTGVLEGDGDPAERYAEFALAARTVLKRDESGAPLPFADWLRRGEATAEDWRLHLTTLFPEVRPKGYVEVRCIDALPAAWYAAPLTLLAGLGDPRTLLAVAELLGPPRGELLAPAARRGLDDPAIADRARSLFRIALDGAASSALVDLPSLATAWDYYDRFTRLGRSPGDEVREPSAISDRLRPPQPQLLHSAPENGKAVVRGG